MCHLIQLFMPTHDVRGNTFDPDLYSEVVAELSAVFKHLSVYTRDTSGPIFSTSTDQPVKQSSMVVYEITTDLIDPEWWSNYRAVLESRFQMREILIRALLMRRL